MTKKKELYTEDIKNMASDAVEDMLTVLSEYRLNVSEKRLTDILETVLYEKIWHTLDEVCPNDYKNHM